MEKVVEVKTYLIYKVCPECNEGYMLENSDGYLIATYPPRMSHKCNKCGYITTYTTSYPKIEYKQISE